MSNPVDISFKNTMIKRLIKYKKRLDLKGENGTDFKALQKMGLQLLNWCVNGSNNSSRVPPIKFGILRGSGTVFVDNKKIGDMKGKYPEGTPAVNYDGKPQEITVGFNTVYAAKLHEMTFTPGPVSTQSGDVGNKYVEDHLKADSKALTKMYALMMQKEQNV